MIELRNVCCKAGEFELKNVNLTVHELDYVVLLGPTGAGKTVLLECIAGIQELTGQVLIEGKEVTSQVPEKREIGYLPQDYVLFPFLSVEENILFPLRQHGIMTARYRQRCDDLVKILQIGHLLHRPTKELSGGEKARIALARALATGPPVLLLDEPYSSLDAGMKRRLWLEMKEVQKQFPATVLHVTHDLEEAFTLGKRAAVLIDGRIEQSGDREDVFYRPRSEKVARFLGIGNIGHGEVTQGGRSDEKIRIRCPGYEIVGCPHADVKPGDRVTYCVRSEQINLHPPGEAPENCTCENRYEGRVIGSIPHGIDHTVYLRVGLENGSPVAGYNFEARLTAERHRELSIKEGSRVTVTVGTAAVCVLDPPRALNARDTGQCGRTASCCCE